MELRVAVTELLASTERLLPADEASRCASATRPAAGHGCRWCSSDASWGAGLPGGNRQHSPRCLAVEWPSGSASPVASNGIGQANRLTKSSAVWATSRQPWSIVREWPRFGIFTISVTPGLRFCRL